MDDIQGALQTESVIPVAVKALLSVGHGTAGLVAGGQVLGGGQLSFDLGRWRPMKHHCTGDNGEHQISSSHQQMLSAARWGLMAKWTHGQRLDTLTDRHLAGLYHLLQSQLTLRHSMTGAALNMQRPSELPSDSH